MTATEEKEYSLEKCKTKQEAILETASRVLSVLFHPFLVPLYAYILMFTLTYLYIMPIQYVYGKQYESANANAFHGTSTK